MLTIHPTSGSATIVPIGVRIRRNTVIISWGWRKQYKAISTNGNNLYRRTNRVIKPESLAGFLWRNNDAAVRAAAPLSIRSAINYD